MAIQRPYFNLHQVITGQYTSGDEYVFANGVDYVGPYHILPTNQYFTGPRPEDDSVEVFIKRRNVTEDALVYNQITKNPIPQYEVPVSFEPRPNLDDYQFGEIERFFVQKRNSSLNSIIEIDSVQYNKINTKGKPGINGVVWKSLKIIWKISKLPVNDLAYENQRKVIAAENDFPGISKYLTNFLEFYQ